MKKRMLIIYTLALSTCVVQAQNTSTATAVQRIHPMNIAQQTTAFFYQNPVVLDREKHKDLRIQSGDARFASQHQAVPLVAAEFAEACLEYPIVFIKGQNEQWMALALTGLKQETNAFVDDQGVWNARYVPVSVRRYPFILAEGANNQLSLAVDMTAPQLGKEGEALLNDKGEPTEFAQNIMTLLANFQNQATSTTALVKQLNEAGLLTQQNLQVRLTDERSAIVEGVWIVDEAKFQQLPDNKVLAWFKSGELGPIYAQMLSLRNLLPLLERSQPAAVKKKAKTARKTSKAKEL
jgi:hypothetical protein